MYEFKCDVPQEAKECRDSRQCTKKKRKKPSSVEIPFGAHHLSRGFNFTRFIFFLVGRWFRDKRKIKRETHGKNSWENKLLQQLQSASFSFTSAHYIVPARASARKRRESTKWSKWRQSHFMHLFYYCIILNCWFKYVRRTTATAATSQMTITLQRTVVWCSYFR